MNDLYNRDLTNPVNMICLLKKNDLIEHSLTFRKYDNTLCVLWETVSFVRLVNNRPIKFTELLFMNFN